MSVPTNGPIYSFNSSTVSAVCSECVPYLQALCWKGYNQVKIPYYRETILQELRISDINAFILSEIHTKIIN